MTEEVLIVPKNREGERLDKFIADSLLSVSRSSVQKLMDEKSVILNGKATVKSVKVKENDEISVYLPDPEELKALPQDIPLSIVYEDNDLLVVNKPKGMVVHPAPGNPDNTLVNALLFHCKGSLSGINGVIRPGIVHRIDKDTSGLLIVAKNDFAHISLSEQIQAHSFKREYRGVVLGHMKSEKGSVDFSIGRSRTDRKKQAIGGINARNAVTHYEVITRYEGFDLCKFRLETGRTHQIRVHCAALGHPIAGDPVYGSEKNTFGLAGQCLHAKTLGFIHPRTGEYMEFDSPLPEYFVNFLSHLKEQ
ncbi:MAG: RluA family pseudouridine synthase [Oscillospiraceae bacterium]|nr:RluA family pseudouridine synthase [Oscillospiraceae bacterium]